MKTTSLLYKAAQASNLIFPVRKVELFRRLADGSGWDATAVDVTAEVVRLERLSWKLDTDALNEFKASNIRIEVENAKRQWDDGSPGRFAGFLRFHSKLRISLGLKVGGADEVFPSFTGVIEDANEDSGTPTLQLDVRSLDQILEDADADQAAILVTNELLGIGDPAGTTIREKFQGKYRGIRVSFGYPACPNLEDQATLFRLLEPQKHAGVTLTEGFMMDPEATVSALVFHHLQARYFSVGQAAAAAE